MKEQNFDNLKNEQTMIDKVGQILDFINRLESDEKFDEAIKEISEIAGMLEEKYPNARRECYLFNVMIGSTIGREECTLFDFSGEDSVVLLLEKLKQELETK